MSDPAPDQIESSKGNEEQVPVPPWLRATISDLQDLDFEAPIAGSNSADARRLSDLFRASIESADESTEPPDSAATRMAILLSAVTGMHFKPREGDEPFGPRIVLEDGSRSAIPSDLRAGHVDLLAELASRAKHPVLRTRLADVCWLLDRKRATLGTMALAGYTEIVIKADKGKLLFGLENERGALHYHAIGYLRRALQIGRRLGWEKRECVTARDVVKLLRKRAVESQALGSLLRIAELDLDFRVSEPQEIGLNIDQAVSSLRADVHSHIVVELWRLGARAYQLAKRDEDRFRCLAAAAEQLVADADVAAKQENSAMLAAHRLSAAIAQLHGIPGKKDRRTDLRHKLIDIQALIPEEMSSFSQDIDLQEIIERVQHTIGNVPLIDKLFIFATLASSPEPEQLVRDAEEMIRQHPLSSLFETLHMDHKGKVIHRTEGTDPANPHISAIANWIAQSEANRRKIAASGKIDPARRIIMDQHCLSDDLFRSLLQHSAFVPGNLVWTFATGFLRLFQADFVSATYILVPLLENSLRYVLKIRGYDVSKFDDATQTQQDKTILQMFEQMRTDLDGVFGTAITTDIENVFLRKPGPHLRHSVAHGLLHDGSPYGADAIYGCWLIFRLCLLPLFAHRGELHLVEA